MLFYFKCLVLVIFDGGIECYILEFNRFHQKNAEKLQFYLFWWNTSAKQKIAKALKDREKNVRGNANRIKLQLNF